MGVVIFLQVLLIIMLIAQSVGYYNFLKTVSRLDDLTKMYSAAFDAVSADIIGFHTRLNNIENNQNLISESQRDLIRDVAMYSLKVDMLVDIAQIDRERFNKAAKIGDDD